MKKKKQLLTDRLILKEFESLSDEEKYKLKYDIFNGVDNVVINNTLIVEILEERKETKYSLELAQEFIDSTTKNTYRFAIYNKESEFIGIIGADLNQINKNATVGYWISQSQRRKGYISEAIKVLIKSCFEDLKLHRLGGSVFSFNEVSSKVLENVGFEKCGMRKESYYRNGAFQDDILYELLEKNYKLSNS